jgi:hypothetical protein
MDYGRILRRAWHLTLHYRALWVFGILLAIFTGSSSGGGGNSGFRFNGGNMGQFSGMPFSGGGNLGSSELAFIAVFILALIALAFLLAIASVVLRYVSQVALMRMVDTTEDTGAKLRWTKGFRLGWSRGAWRLFLIDLVITIPLIIVFGLLFLLALTPLLAWAAGDTTVGIIGTVATIGLFLLVVLLAIIVAVALSVLRQFFYRMAVLRDYGVFDSIRHGWAVVRARFTQAGSMWLILVGIGIAYGIAMLVVALVLLVVGGVVAIIPGLAVYAAVYSVAGTGAAVAAGLLVGLPVFLIIVIVPSLFISGLWEVFHSSVWTLTFRELAGAAMPPAAPATPEPPMVAGPAEAI